MSSPTFGSVQKLLFKIIPFDLLQYIRHDLSCMSSSSVGLHDQVDCLHPVSVFQVACLEQLEAFNLNKLQMPLELLKVIISQIVESCQDVFPKNIHGLCLTQTESPRCEHMEHKL